MYQYPAGLYSHIVCINVWRCDIRQRSLYRCRPIVQNYSSHVNVNESIRSTTRLERHIIAAEEWYELVWHTAVTAGAELSKYLQSVVIATSSSNCYSDKNKACDELTTWQAPAVILDAGASNCELLRRHVWHHYVCMYRSTLYLTLLKL